MRARWRLGPYIVEQDPDCLFNGLEVIKLPKRHLDTLILLLQAEGEVVSKEQFFERIWTGLHVEEGNLTQTIFLLRKSLGRLPNGGEYIETMPRRGYRLVPGIAEKEESPLEAVSPCAADAATAGTEPYGIAASTGIRPHFPAWPVLATWGVCALVVCAILAALFWVKEYEHPRLARMIRLTNDGVYKEVLAPLLSDGSRLYFTEIADNQNRLAEVPVLGGPVLERSGPSPMHTALAVSRWHEGVLFGKTWEEGGPAGSRFTAEEPTEPMMVMTPDHAVRHAGQAAGHSAAWSPDGQSLAFTAGHELLIADGNGDGTHVLTHTPGVPYAPAWSADGRKLRFSVQDDDAGSSLWEIDRAGGTARSLLKDSENATRACCGQWSPNGDWFVYVMESQNHSSLWLRRERGVFTGQEFELASGPMDYWRSPVFSENGRQIYAIGEHARGEILRFDPGKQQWWPAFEGLSADTLQFSPDRRWMVYTLYPEGTVWRSRPDGTEKMQLSAAGELGRFPHWSPDGLRVVYMGARPGEPWCVEEVTAAGGRRPRPVLRESASQGAATYSPDGRQVAFGRVISYGVAARPQEGISVVDLQSGSVAKVPGSEGLWIARWSPDGRWLAAASADRQRLMLFDWKSGQWTELSRQGVNDLVWTHDGKALFFDARNGRGAAVFRVDMTDRSITRYADLGGVQRTGFSGWRLSLNADDELLVLRQAGTMEVYGLELDRPD